MTTLQTVRREARKYNATVNVLIPIGNIDLEVDAPKGKVWACSGSHMLVACQLGGELRRDLYDDLLIRMESGLMDCPDRECDLCYTGVTR